MWLKRMGEDARIRTLRVFVVGIEGNVVRLSFETAPDVEIVREELLPEQCQGLAEARIARSDFRSDTPAAAASQ